MSTEFKLGTSLPDYMCGVATNQNFTVSITIKPRHPLFGVELLVLPWIAKEPIVGDECEMPFEPQLWKYSIKVTSEKKIASTMGRLLAYLEAVEKLANEAAAEDSKTEMNVTSEALAPVESMAPSALSKSRMLSACCNAPYSGYPICSKCDLSDF